LTSRCAVPIVRDVSTRTTLTLDDDVASGLMEAVRTTGRPMKAVVNDAIRAGLAELPARKTRFVVKSRDLGLRPGFDLDNLEELLELAEGVDHR